MTRQGSCLNPTPRCARCCGSAGGLEQGYLAGGYRTSSVGHRPGRATRLPVVAPCYALGCVGHGRAHRSAHSSGLQTARRMRPGDKTPSRSNLCEAQQRLGVIPVRRVFDLVVKPLATPQTPAPSITICA